MNKKKLIISIIYLVSAFLFLKTDLFFFKFLNSDPSTLLFFSILPLTIWIANSKTAILVAIFFMILTAFFDYFKFEKTSENLAIQSFFFFGYGVFLSIKELIKHK
ncbi:MAG: hypothetical protein AAB705_00735 [Patescibacteria group bacterium]